MKNVPIKISGEKKIYSWVEENCVFRGKKNLQQQQQQIPANKIQFVSRINHSIIHNMLNTNTFIMQ
jgi:ABC-type tungstate transport system permease subunit